MTACVLSPALRWARAGVCETGGSGARRRSLPPTLYLHRTHTLVLVDYRKTFVNGHDSGASKGKGGRDLENAVSTQSQQPRLCRDHNSAPRRRAKFVVRRSACLPPRGAVLGGPVWEGGRARGGAAASAAASRDLADGASPHLCAPTRALTEGALLGGVNKTLPLLNKFLISTTSAPRSTSRTSCECPTHAARYELLEKLWVIGFDDPT